MPKPTTEPKAEESRWQPFLPNLRREPLYLLPSFGLIERLLNERPKVFDTQESKVVDDWFLKYCESVNLEE